MQIWIDTGLNNQHFCSNGLCKSYAHTFNIQICNLLSTNHSNNISLCMSNITETESIAENLKV